MLTFGTTITLPICSNKSVSVSYLYQKLFSNISHIRPRGGERCRDFFYSIYAVQNKGYWESFHLKVAAEVALLARIMAKHFSHFDFLSFQSQSPDPPEQANSLEREKEESRKNTWSTRIRGRTFEEEVDCFLLCFLPTCILAIKDKKHDRSGLPTVSWLLYRGRILH